MDYVTTYANSGWFHEFKTDLKILTLIGFISKRNEKKIVTDCKDIDLLKEQLIINKVK